MAAARRSDSSPRDKRPHPHSTTANPIAAAGAPNRPPGAPAPTQRSDRSHERACRPHWSTAPQTQRHSYPRDIATPSTPQSRHGETAQTQRSAAPRGAHTQSPQRTQRDTERQDAPVQMSLRSAAVIAPSCGSTLSFLTSTISLPFSPSSAPPCSNGRALNRFRHSDSPPLPARGEPDIPAHPLRVNLRGWWDSVTSRRGDPHAHTRSPAGTRTRAHTTTPPPPPPSPPPPAAQQWGRKKLPPLPPPGPHHTPPPPPSCLRYRHAGCQRSAVTLSRYASPLNSMGRFSTQGTTLS
eukprot:COSAG02_NODE_3557_length_6565_cov_395.452830_7_plen_295_part_00